MLGPLRDQTDTICKAQRGHVFGDFNRDFKIQRRGRQRERQKNNWFN